MNGVQILGTGSYVPENKMTNFDLSHLVDTSDEWIVSRTGIKERRISTGENTSELAAKAAEEAIKAAGISAEKIDMIIVATITPDQFMPSTACLVQAAIGADKATCFDVSAACSGFVYGLTIATQFIQTGLHKTVLVIGAEVLSKVLNWEDRNTCVLFGDGAGAVVLQQSTKNGILSLYTGSNGSQADLLACPAVPVNNPCSEENQLSTNFMSMKGKEVFKFACGIVMKSIQQVLQDTGYTTDDMKYILLHQANSRIIDVAIRKLKMDPEKFYINLNQYGNTSAASIPLALDEMVKKDLLQTGDKLIFVGFGGGLTWGAALVEWK